MLKNFATGTALLTAISLAAPALAQETGCAGITADGVGIPKQGMVLTWENGDGDRFKETILATQNGFTVTHMDFGEDFTNYTLFYRHEYLTEYAMQDGETIDDFFPPDGQGGRIIAADILEDLGEEFAMEISALNALWPLQQGKSARIDQDMTVTTWTIGASQSVPFPDGDGATETIAIRGETLGAGFEPGIWTLSYSPEHCIVVALEESHGHDTYSERVVGIELP